MMPMPPPGHAMRNADAAKRFFDAYTLHRTVLSVDEILAGRWMVVRLADGGSDNTVYDTHAAAVESARNSPSRCFYPRIMLERMSVEWCDVMLWYVRTCYDNGHRADPAAQLIIPTRIEDVRSRVLKTKTWR